LQQNFIARSLKILLVLCLAYLIVMLARYVMPESETSVVTQPETIPEPSLSSQPPTAQNTQPEETRLSDIANEDQTGNKPKRVNAVDPRINLILHGTFLSADPGTAHAIIADASGIERRYVVGDSITGGIIIHEIMTNKVILLRGERYEALLLWPGDNQDIAMQGKLTTASSTEDQTSAYGRPIFRESRQSLIDLVQPQPVHVDGKFVGFRLKPLKNNYLLSQFGLRQDDVVMSINGVDLDNPMKGMRTLRGLSTGEYVNMTVRRNGQNFTLSFNIPL
jgi:general secretion pathway protein C